MSDVTKLSSRRFAAAAAAAAGGLQQQQQQEEVTKLSSSRRLDVMAVFTQSAFMLRVALNLLRFSGCRCPPKHLNARLTLPATDQGSADMPVRLSRLVSYL
jgi:hypothetical protein